MSQRNPFVAALERVRDKYKSQGNEISQEVADAMIEEVGLVCRDHIHFRPLGNTLYIQRDKPVEKHGNIDIPDSAREVPNTGVVMAAGPKATIPVGSRVLWSHFAGAETPTPNGSVILMPETVILGLLEPDSASSPPPQS